MAAAAKNPTSARAVPSRQLVVDYVQYRLRREGLEVPSELEQYTAASSGEDGGRAVEGKLRPVLRDLGDEFERRYKDVFSEMCSPLKLTQANAESTFQTLVEHLFEGSINWGRIVGLFAFCGALAAFCVEKHMPTMVDQIVNKTTLYIDNNLFRWIDKNGGWNGLVEFYNNRDDNQNADSSWPCLSSICGYVFSAVGVLTLTAVLARK